ncbi:MAG: NADPH:quinone oxidoreductase family protein [Gammaproteobacteria bacterium]|nr:NADPH:quinone oxidoreductase family protein [Gammaproteobacteria bacterium]
MSPTRQTRAVVATALGGPEVLEIRSLPVPPPAAGQVQVEARAWGVNYVDVLMVRGGYQLKPDPPFVPGMEAAGVISAIGPGVTGLVVGDRVMTAHRPGAFAELVNVPVEQVWPVPDALDLPAAAVFRSAHYTAWHSLVQRAAVQPGEWVLVHAATGGVGLAAVQVARLRGARVIATGGRDDKLAVVRAQGAEHVIRLDGQGFRDEVKRITDGRGVDVVLDPVGAEVFDESIRCLAWGARILVIGFVGGEPARARTNHLLIKGASVIGIRAGEFGRRNPAIRDANMRDLLAHAAAGELRPHISHRFAFESVAAAFEVVAAREVIGKAVLVAD